MRPKLIVDLDGTLLDDSQRHWEVFSLVSSLTIPKSQYWKKRRDGLSNKEITFQLKGKDNFDIDRFKILIESRDFLKSDLLISSDETLKRLNDTYEMILCTIRSQEENCLWQLSQFGLGFFFHQIVVIPHSEINPVEAKAPFLQNIGLKMSDKIVGDTEMDILTGKLLGIKTIAVASGIRNKHQLILRSPDIILDNINDLT